MSHCEHCPIDPESGACPAISRGHRPYCELVKPGSRYRDGFQVELLQLAGLASPVSLSPRPVGSMSVPPPSSRVVIRAVAAGQTGYGRMIEQVGRSLEALGVPVAYEMIGSPDGYPDPDEFVASRTISDRPEDAWVLQVLTPLSPIDPARGTVTFTMWESSRLSKDAVANLNRAQLIVVPCQWNAEGFKTSGVTRPIVVVPLGVTPSSILRNPRRDDQPFRFGIAGRLNHGGIRKGLAEGIATFRRAFEGRTDVSLEVKCSASCAATLDVGGDPRIRLRPESLSDEGMAEWYASLDAYVSPTKAEGWGLQTLEAMSAGVPVIACRYSGTAEFFDSACGWEVDYDLASVATEIYGGIGEWAVPREDSLIAAMRAAAGDPMESLRRGVEAAERAKAFPWGRTGRELMAALVRAGMLTDPDAPPSQAPRADAFHAGNGAMSSNPPGSHWERLQFVAACDCRGPRPVRESPGGEEFRVDPTRDPIADVAAWDYRLDYQHDEGIASCGCADVRHCLRGHGLVTLSQCLECVTVPRKGPHAP